jgi:Mce-associated membrane protein
MTGPRKPPRPTAPRGKIRVAGSGPSSGRVRPDDADSEQVSLTKPRQDDDSKPQKAKTDSSAEVDSSTQAGFLTWSKVLIVAAVAVVVGIFAVVAAFKPGAEPQENMAFVNASATNELKAQTGDQLCKVIAINPDDLDGWAKSAQSALRGEALKNFNDYLPTQRDLATQSGQGAECKIDTIAVTSQTGDTASALAILIVSSTQQGVALPNGSGQVRFDVGLQKVDDQWMISRISDF